LPIKEPTDRGRRASVHDRCNYTEKQLQMLFIDSLRDLLWLNTPISLCERQPLRGEKQPPLLVQALFSNRAISDD